MRELERYLLLQIIDMRWREHLHDMDYLREGIHLRGIGGMTDPLVIYKNEAFKLFGDLMNLIWGDFARMIYHVQVTLEAPPGTEPQPLPTRRPSPAASSATGGARVSYSGGAGVPAGSQAIAAAAAAEASGGVVEGYAEAGGNGSAAGFAVEQRRTDDEPGRNDPCWCGSGKKYKKCHGA